MSPRPCWHLVTPLLLIPTFLLAILLTRPAAGASFALTSLGAIANSSSYYNSRANALNNAGLIAATAFKPPSGTPLADARAATFDPYAPSPSLSLLVPYTPSTPGSVTQSHPRGINSAGTVVGFFSDSYSGRSGSNDRAFFFRDGTLTTLPTLGSRALAINDAGTVVGQSGGYAFAYSGSTFTDLWTRIPGNNSAAFSINSRGDIVGFVQPSSTSSIIKPFVYRIDSPYFYVDTLPLPAGAYSAAAVDINDLGTILVSADFLSGTKTVTRPFLYSNGSYTPLPLLPDTTSFIPRALNDFNQVVGQSLSPTGARLATLYTAGRTIDLASLLPAGTGFSPFDATDINVNGLITGTALFQSRETGFLLAPPPGDANMNGTIDPDDYALLDRAYARSLHNAHWSDGDFNYDGQITSADYFIIDNALGQSHGFSPEFLSQRESQFGPEYVSQLLASVPEPNTLVACGIAIAISSRRRP